MGSFHNVHFYEPGTEFNRILTAELKNHFYNRGGLTVADSAIEDAVSMVAQRTIEKLHLNWLINDLPT